MGVPGENERKQIHAAMHALEKGNSSGLEKQIVSRMGRVIPSPENVWSRLPARAQKGCELGQRS